MNNLVVIYHLYVYCLWFRGVYLTMMGFTVKNNQELIKYLTVSGIGYLINMNSKQRNDITQYVRMWVIKRYHIILVSQETGGIVDNIRITVRSKTGAISVQIILTVNHSNYNAWYRVAFSKCMSEFIFVKSFKDQVLVSIYLALDFFKIINTCTENLIFLYYCNLANYE